MSTSATITHNPRTSTSVLLVDGVVTYSGPEPLGMEGVSMAARMLVYLDRPAVLTIRRVRAAGRVL